MNAALTPLKSLLEDARAKHYDSGQLIFYAGDDPNEILILRTGIVKVYDIDSKGQERVLQLVKGPAILPLDCLISSTSQQVRWHYGALTDVNACAFSSEELQQQMAKNPDLSTYIINWLAVESHELLVRIDSMNKSDAAEKVVSVLKFLNVYYTGPEKRGWKQIEFPLTQQLIADIAGITRESATVHMGNLQKKKIIRSRRPFLEINVKRLHDLDSKQ